MKHGWDVDVTSP